MDLRKLKTLIELVQESGIAELEVTEGEERVRITRTVANAPQPFMQYAAPMMQAMQPSPAMAAPMAAHAAAPVAEPAAALPTGHIVKSPMVGTFYRSAAPGAKPFVEVGSSVNVGDTICIIEAMKLMNDITAPASGRIVDICTQDGAVIEYGQTIMKIV